MIFSDKPGDLNALFAQAGAVLKAGSALGGSSSNSSSPLPSTAHSSNSAVSEE